MDYAIQVKSLEISLSNARTDEQRLLLLNQLVCISTFTDLKKAEKLIAELALLLKKINSQDILFQYYLSKAAIENQKYQYQNAIEYFEKALEIVENVGDATQQAETYIDYAGTCINTNRMELAESFLQKSKKRIKLLDNKKLIARMICREGYLKLHYGHYSEAIELFLKAQKITDSFQQPIEPKDAYFTMLVQSGLGKIYERNDEKEKSVEAYQRVIDMCEITGMKSRMAWHYLNLGNAFLALEQLSDAEHHFNQAVLYNDDLNKQARASAYANLGFCKFLKNEYDEALELFSMAEKQFDDPYNLSIIESRKGSVYMVSQSYENALSHFLQALRYAKSIDDYRQISSVCKEIAELYAGIEDYKNAYAYQNLHHTFAERYLEQVNIRQQMELQIKYEAEKKQQQAKMAQLQATQLQLKALRAQMNPHFMYNALNSIQHFITLHDAASAAKYLAKFANLMRKSLEYSDLEVISLEKEIEFLRDYLIINEKLRFEDLLKFEITIDDEIEEDIIGVPTMIIQPYVENAIEHGLRSRKKGLVKIEFFLQDEETILCVVEDNGIGRKKARALQLKDQAYHNHKSMGTSITEKRLQLLHNQTSNKVFVKTIDLEKPSGTRVEISIPIIELL
jgi:two-component system, LytTR family, sensor kinase